MSIRKRLELLMRSEMSARRSGWDRETLSSAELAQDARSVLQRLRQQQSRAAARSESHRMQAEELEARAAAALRHGDEGGARELLTERFYVLKRRDEYEQELRQLQAQSDELRDTLESYDIEVGASGTRNEGSPATSYYAAAREAWSAPGAQGQSSPSDVVRKSETTRADAPAREPFRRDPLRTWSSGEWSDEETPRDTGIAYTEEDVGVGEVGRATDWASAIEEPFARFDEMERKISAAEVRADVLRELSPQAEDDALRSRIDRLEREGRLADLRQQKAGGERPDLRNDAPSGDDALARLQRRLNTEED